MGICKYFKNEDYFSDMSLQSSYWAGFIAADGCMHRKDNSFSLEISLAKKDKNVLQRLVKDSKYTGDIKEYKNCCRLLINATKKWAEDLKNIYGIVPAKTWILEPPSNLNEENKLAFLIGYIDGDGCIYIRNRKYLALEIVSVSEKFIKWAHKELSKYFTRQFNDKCRIYKDKYNRFIFKLLGAPAQDVLYKLDSVPVNKLMRKWENILMTEAPIRKRNYISSKDYKEILEMKNNGASYAEIGRKFSVYGTTIYRLIGRLNNV